MKNVLSSGWKYLHKMLISFISQPILYLGYKGNIWNLYSSYNRQSATWKKMVWNNYMQKHAASISIDAKIDAPLILPHGVSGIFISQSAKIGKKVVIFQQVTIGANTIRTSKSYGAPTIGNNVYIGSGAKIIGGISIGDNARIGANACVVKDIPHNSIVVSPEARIIVKDTLLDNTFVPYLS